MRLRTETQNSPEEIVTQEHLESQFQLAKSEASAEAVQARDKVLEALREELKASVEQDLKKKFGPTHRFEASEYIQHIVGKVLEDWNRPQEDRQFWSKSSFQDLVPYAHRSCINRALDSQKALGLHEKKLLDEDALGIEERQQQQDPRNSPDTLHPMVKQDKKIQEILEVLNEGVARAAITDRGRDVLLAREYRDPKPTRKEVMQEFGLSNEDEVTAIVGRVKLWLRDQFKHWGPGGETIKD